MTKREFFNKLGLKPNDFEKYVGAALPSGNEISDETAQKYRKMWRDEVERRAKAVCSERVILDEQIAENRKINNKSVKACEGGVAWLKCNSQTELDEAVESIKNGGNICLCSWKFSGNFKAKFPQVVGLKVVGNKNKAEHFCTCVNYKRHFSRGKSANVCDFWVAKIRQPKRNETKQRTK